jgi:hypothetical protein
LEQPEQPLDVMERVVPEAPLETALKRDINLETSPDEHEGQMMGLALLKETNSSKTRSHCLQRNS